MRIPRPLAIALLLGAACSEPAAPRVDLPAYDPTQLTGVLYRWPAGRTVAVFTDSTSVPAGTNLALATARAMEVWKQALDGGQFAFRTAASATDADVIVHVSGAPRLVGLAGCAEPPTFAGGVTFFCPAADSALTLPLTLPPTGGARGRVKVDISINPAATSAANPLTALVTHELGHALGIGGHSPDAGDVMFGAPQVSAPSVRDRTTLRWLVRQPIGLRL